SIDRLLAAGPEPPPGTGPAAEAMYYSESWALVHMLMSQPDYRDRAPALLLAIAHGTASTEALSATYGKSVAAVTADLRKYSSRFKFDSTLVDAAARPSNVQVNASADADLDATLTLGSILGWQMGHADEGRAVLEAIEPD